MLWGELWWSSENRVETLPLDVRASASTLIGVIGRIVWLRRNGLLAAVHLSTLMWSVRGKNTVPIELTAISLAHRPRNRHEARHRRLNRIPILGYSTIVGVPPLADDHGGGHCDGADQS